MFKGIISNFILLFKAKLEPQTSTPLKFAFNIDESQSKQYFKSENSRGTRFLSCNAVALLSDWFHENRDYPYPDDATTDFLAKKAGWYFKIILNHLIYKLIIFF